MASYWLCQGVLDTSLVCRDLNIEIDKQNTLIADMFLYCYCTSLPELDRFEFWDDLGWYPCDRMPVTTRILTCWGSPFWSSNSYWEALHLKPKNKSQTLHPMLYWEGKFIQQMMDWHLRTRPLLSQISQELGERMTDEEGWGYGGMCSSPPPPDAGDSGSHFQV